jgi:ShK domain-like
VNSATGNEVMTPKKSEGESAMSKIGKATTLSEGDSGLLNKMYCTESKQLTTTTTMTLMMMMMMMMPITSTSMTGDEGRKRPGFGMKIFAIAPWRARMRLRVTETVVVTSGNCNDQNLSCGSWAAKNYCKNPEYLPDLPKTCGVSCKTCKFVDFKGKKIGAQ